MQMCFFVSTFAQNFIKIRYAVQIKKHIFPEQPATNQNVPVVALGDAHRYCCHLQL